MGRRKRIRKIEKWARNNPPLLPVEHQALPRARVTLCEAVTWLATGKASSGKVLRQMSLSDDIPDDVQTRQKIELAGRHLWDALGDNDLPMFGHRVNDYGEPSVEIEQIPSEKSLSRRTTTAPLMELVDDTISVGGTTYVGVTMRRSDLLRHWAASTPVDLRINSTAEVATVSQALAKRTFSKSKVRGWYTKRVKEWPPGQRPPSRDEDIRAAKEEFCKAVTHEFIRGLRDKIAPPEWTARGRPKIQ